MRYQEWAPATGIDRIRARQVASPDTFINGLSEELKIQFHPSLADRPTK